MRRIVPEISPRLIIFRQDHLATIILIDNKEQSVGTGRNRFALDRGIVCERDHGVFIGTSPPRGEIASTKCFLIPAILNQLTPNFPAFHGRSGVFYGYR